MNRILIVLSLALGAVFGVAIQPAAENATPQQIAASSTSAEAASHQVQPYNTAAASSPQGNVLPAPFYYPTYPEYNKEAGYSVQTGYEGYLVPAATSAPQSSGWTTGLWSMMYPMSRVALRYGARAGVYFLNLLLLLFLGGIFTTSVCTFTPLCTITLLGLGKAQVKEQVTELARTYMTPERISAATSLVKKAIDKYATMQKEASKEETEDPEHES